MSLTGPIWKRTQCAASWAEKPFSGEPLLKVTQTCLGAHSPPVALPATTLSVGLLALGQLSQNLSFHRDNNGPQPPTVEYKDTATYLKGDRRDEGTPVGRLGSFVQQGLDLWM